MEIDREALAQTLVRQLNPVLPEGTWLELHGGNIDFCAPDGTYATMSLDWGDVDVVVDQFLNSVQDHVAHATRGMPWPPGSPESGEPLALPFVEVGPDKIRFGYGEDPVVLAFAPIASAAAEPNPETKSTGLR
jgi:hypothetical protein